MRLATVISLGASALLGVGALFVARVWLPSSAAPAAPTEPPGVSVVVATTPLAYGVKLEAKHLAVARLPAGSAPEGAFTSVEQVLAQDGGAPVVLVPITAREPVLPSKLTGPGARPTIAAMITDGMRAYTIRISEVAGVGGHALPGDRVDVLLMRDLSGDTEQQRLVTDVVLQNVKLLGVDLNADPTSSTPAAPRTATVEVDIEDAQKLAMASDLGALSLALRRSGAADTEIMRPIAAIELGVTGAPARKTAASVASPTAPGAAAAPRQGAAAPRRAGRTGVVVVHGDNATLHDVPSYRGAGV